MNLQGPHQKKRLRLSGKTPFLLVTLFWTAGGLLGALPYYLSGALPRFADALYESVSGFSTTGATVFADVEALSRPLLFWRCLTHWLGGMGIVALTIIFLPFLGARGIQLFQAESPGPETDKLRHNIAGTAGVLWLIYLALTLAQTVLLMLCGMDWFDALTHSFSTVATGGFSNRNGGIGAYRSPGAEWVCIIFMFIAAFNFNVLFRLLQRRWRELFTNSEAKAYILVILIAASVCFLQLRPLMPASQGIRQALFQTLSMISTTGFSIADQTRWPPGAQACLFLLMFTGGCSSSTSGGFKLIRHVTLFKQMKNEIKRLLNPRGVFCIRLDQKVAPKEVIHETAGFLFIYMGMILLSMLVISAAGLDLFSSLNLSLLSLGNIGLGLGQSDFGPVIYALPAWTKWYLSFLMIAGRLELWTVFVLFSSEWRR